MKRVTIRDVAKASGFSITTASLVLNNKNVSIPQKTRDKVWDAAQTLGYRPNQLAVGMITKKTRILGLIIPDNSNLFFAELSKSIEETAWERGYNLIYGNSGNTPERDVYYLEMFLDRQVDGIIYAQSAYEGRDNIAKINQFLNQIHIPLVTVDRQVEQDSIPTVALDHFKGGYLATSHLVELGHRRIACFTGPSGLPSSDQRLDGYRSALLDAGIQLDESLHFEGKYRLGREYDALAHFLAKGVTAVFVFNDLMAIGLYREAWSAGISIPNDLSIVGFDNIPFSDMIQPGLSTISQPIREIGKCSVNVLLKLIEEDSKDFILSKYIFEPKLVVRQSTAPLLKQE